MQLKTHHKVGIGATVGIIILVIALAAAGAFAVYHHYELKAGSPNNPPGDVPPIDSSATNDGISTNVKHASTTESMSDSMTSPRDEKQISGYHTAEQIKGDINTYIAQHQGQGLIGIVHVVAKHSNGVVFADFTQHNTRTVQGIGCFGTLFYPPGTYPVTNTTKVCPISPKNWGAFNVIALINGTPALVLNGSDKPDNSTVGNKCCDGHGTGSRASAKDGLIMTTTANEGGPSQGTVANSGGLYNTWTITSGTYTFSGTTGMTVRGAMLVNATNAYPNSPVAYAENAFTPISLASGDSLSLTWTVSAS